MGRTRRTAIDQGGNWTTYSDDNGAGGYFDPDDTSQPGDFVTPPPGGQTFGIQGDDSGTTVTTQYLPITWPGGPTYTTMAIYAAGLIELGPGDASSFLNANTSGSAAGFDGDYIDFGLDHTQDELFVGIDSSGNLKVEYAPYDPDNLPFNPPSTFDIAFDSSGFTLAPASHVEYSLNGNYFSGAITATTHFNWSSFSATSGVTVLTGTSGNNTITGGAGDDLIEGLGGNDLLNGGGGANEVTYAHAPRSVTVSLALTGQQDTLGAGRDTLSNFQALSGSAFNDTLRGGTGANVLRGVDGNDTLDGGGGADRLDGGNGSDTASYASAAAAVTVSLAVSGAQDTIGAGVDTLVSIENLAGSSYNDTLTGNAADNRLFGSSGADLLEGGLGNDLLDGGNGSGDVASYAHSSVGVTVTLATTAVQATGMGSDQLSGMEGLMGSNFADTLTGNTGDNSLFGGGGDDMLVGGLGRDTLSGGTGFDTASYAAATGGVTVNLSMTGAQDTISAGSDRLSGVERLLGSAYGDTLIGGAGSEKLYGGAGSDKLVGGAGNDLLDGGSGTDAVSYYTSTAGVKVSLAIAGAQNTLGAGTDTLVSFENLYGSPYNDVLTGSSGNNVLRGSVGNDLLYGGGGNDTLVGGAGNDLLDGGSNTDIASYDDAGAGVKVSLLITGAQNTTGSGTDTLSGIEGIVGSGFNDTLTGANGNNSLSGGAGNDVLIGNGGADTLTGGLGDDLFVYKALTDSTPGARDLIADLGATDRIDLSAIDADTATTGDQAFHKVAGFGHHAGEFTLAYNSGANLTMLSGDVNGDGTADLVITFTGDVTGFTGNWIL